MATDDQRFTSLPSLLQHCEAARAASRALVVPTQSTKATRRVRGRAHYNRAGWPLCGCAKCGQLHYVEPHGTTAFCTACFDTTEHESLDE
jgi:hypothetical protein